jgi:pantoate--beta-alanine ligase
MTPCTGFSEHAMRLVRTIAALRAALDGHPQVNFVPTMGNLHAGHLSLVRMAVAHPGLSVASIFVNPLQFGPQEDFATYPRTLERDCAQLESAGCDVAFAPSPAEMYPEEQEFRVVPPARLADILEGSVRPGFFTGVCTVVSKLFAIVRPTRAVFGKKDYQQLQVITGMVRQFALPIDVIAGETVREPSGLALSSRNGYLSEAEHVKAALLHAQLARVAADVRAGSADHAALEQRALHALSAAGWEPDYVAVRTRADLRVPASGQAHEPLIVLGAARLGRTRLIDNLEIGA